MNFWEIYWSALVFVIGTCLGSFLNVCIYRIPAEKSVVHPPSACPKCRMRIKGYDNIPILSWILLKAKCRGCGTKISARYPFVEALTGLLFLALWLTRGPALAEEGSMPLFACYALSSFGLIFGTFVDLDAMWIPDRVTIGGMILFPVLSLFVPELHGVSTQLAGLVAGLIGLVVGFGLFWLIGVLGKLAFKKEAMGFGDVKLMGGLGALLGWQSVLFILFVSALVGSVVGISLLKSGKKELQSQIPYGPYLAVAAIFWMLGGYRLWAAYIASMGF